METSYYLENQDLLVEMYLTQKAEAIFGLLKLMLPMDRYFGKNRLVELNLIPPEVSRIWVMDHLQLQEVQEVLLEMLVIIMEQTMPGYLLLMKTAL